MVEISKWDTRFQNYQSNVSKTNLNVNRAHFQLADWLTADFMDEQLRGQRALAGHYNTLHGLIKKQPALANWIFDNKLNA